LVSSLEKKIDETEKKYEEANRVSEERLKQASDAETKIIQLKSAMQRLLPLAISFLSFHLISANLYQYLYTGLKKNSQILNLKTSFFGSRPS